MAEPSEQRRTGVRRAFGRAFATMDDGTRIELNRDQFFKLLEADGASDFTVGENHGEAWGKIVRALWPELIERSVLGELAGKHPADAAFVECWRQWTNSPIPGTHAHWRHLAHWVGIGAPETISDDWIEGQLLPALTARKQREAEQSTSAMSSADLPWIVEQVRKVATGDNIGKNLASVHRLTREIIRSGAFGGVRFAVFRDYFDERAERRPFGSDGRNMLAALHWLAQNGRDVGLSYPTELPDIDPRHFVTSFPSSDWLRPHVIAFANVIESLGRSVTPAVGSAAGTENQSSVAPASQSLSPKSYLHGWREILNALGKDNNSTEQRRVREAHERYNGPIIMPAQGGQPKAVRAVLLAWWNELEDRYRSEAAERDATFDDHVATVANRYEQGRSEHSETVVPEISGHIKRRRGNSA